MAAVTWGPLIFDYIPERRMGTYMGGIATVTGLFGFVLQSFSGVWVSMVTTFFGTRGKSEYDYSAVFVLGIILASFALLLTVVFRMAERRGWVVKQTDSA